MYISREVRIFYLTCSQDKFQSLMTPFLIVCTDDILGPFPATLSDQFFVNDNNWVYPWFLEENDVISLDRGFRVWDPNLTELRSMEIWRALPLTKDRNETLLATIQANKSRLVTLYGWVVEIINGRFKRNFHLFRQDYFNTTPILKSQMPL